MIDYEALPEILTWAAILSFIYYILYRKYIYSILDPLFFHTWGTGFSGVLVINVITDQRYIIHYFVCQLFLFIGFIVIQKQNLFHNTTKAALHFYDRNILANTAYAVFGIYIIANLYVFAFQGAALFSDDPFARVTLYGHGFGFVKDINRGAGGFLSAGFIILYITKPKRIYLLLTAILAFFTALEGSKSATLHILIIGVALIYHPFAIGSQNIVNNLKKYVPILILVITVLFFAVLSKSYNSDLFLAFITRLLYGADCVLYFYLPSNEYLQTTYHPLDFISYSVNPVLSFLRLVPAVEPFGTTTVQNARLGLIKDDTLLGPNTPFYIEGQIFFGYYGAFIYSFFIGCLDSFLRKFFFSLSGGSYFLLALSASFFYDSALALIETSLFTVYIMDTCLLVLPVYVVVNFVTRRKIVFRKWQFGASYKNPSTSL